MSADKTQNDGKEDDGSRMQAVQLMPGEYHWRHGITFKRLQQRLDSNAEGNGDVQLCVGGLIFRIPASEWASIITEVSNGARYEYAQEFHMLPPPFWPGEGE